MATVEKTTFCRICEMSCGLKVTVEDDVVVKIRPDEDHPISRGFACPKGIAMSDLQNDPERVTVPLRRTAAGNFERVSWAEALSDIGIRLRAIRDQHGMGSIGFYMGNPVAFSYSSLVWVKGTADALGSPHFYSPSSQDISSRFVANALLYGSPMIFPVPDLLRTDFLLMVGANPVVSHGSAISGTFMRKDMAGIVERGGRVVVVDPRRTETAKLFEHVAVKPDGDAALLLSMLHVIFDEGLENAEACAGLGGVEDLRRYALDFAPERVEELSGIPATEVRSLARGLAGAPSACVYGRTGACLGASGTLVNVLLDGLTAVTGNIDRPGGLVFPSPPIEVYDLAIKQGFDTYATKFSRVGGYPELLGWMPGGVMAEEITTPGPGQMRALTLIGGNPALSFPDGGALEAAMEQLDLMVAIDIYISESSRHADYILPATTWLEREDLLSFTLPYQIRSHLQFTDAVVPPRDEARQEWQILTDLCAELGTVPSSAKALRKHPRLARWLNPVRLHDLLLRMGPVGDKFGFKRDGLNIKKLRAMPQGILLSEEVPTGVLAGRITHPDGRMHLSNHMDAELDRLRARRRDEEFPMLIFGRRDLRSLNSWMHNSPKLMRGNDGPRMWINPADAAELELETGDTARVTSAHGSVEIPVELRDEVRLGAVSLPHGWGHAGGWSLANSRPGVNYNVLTEAGAGALEGISGMAHFNGVAVRVEAVHAATSVPPAEQAVPA
jgi:anaerobic selenocysteine-containing dehydrogenase